MRRAPYIEVFGHRGACALRPEHTLASYAKAIADGADYVEPDLVCTKDGVLVARHEDEISTTTDVAARPDFASRRTSKVIDGESFDGWFVSDFTLAELKTLRAKERIPEVRAANTAYDGQFQVPTFEEIIDFVAAQSATIGRVVGIIPELKNSTFFKSIGLPLEDRFVAILQAHEYTRRAPVEIQSFEVANLKYLRGKLGKRANVRIMQLSGDPRKSPADMVAAGGKTLWAEITSAAGLKEVAEYADVIAPNVQALIPRDVAGNLSQPTPVIRDAHAAGLLVHTWTFRPENRFLPTEFRNDAGDNARNAEGSIKEIRRYLEAGIDGFFADDPAVGRTALNVA
ncbi:MAG: glycerophosphodiester phosphodiesterase [Gammaproteobacteria bacterium]|nr:MAG: glycerophosphodiester phosphodiesterase [Gammaproteobacteria bacterium]